MYPMTGFEIFSLIISGYATLLSTIIALAKLLESKNVLDISLVYTAFYDTWELVLTNRGKKPIFITNIMVTSDGYSIAPYVFLFDQEPIPLPLLLKPQTEERGLLSSVIYDDLAKDRVKITVIDNRAKKITKFKRYELNLRIGEYKEIKKNSCPLLK